MLEFYWRDPVPEDPKSLELPEVPGMWSHYYAPFYSAWLSAKGRSSAVDDVGLFSVEGLDIKIGIHPKIEAALSQGSWDEAQKLAIALYDELAQSGYRSDGLKLQCGDTWSKPFEESVVYRGSRDDEPPQISDIER